MHQILDVNAVVIPPERHAMEKFWETAMTRERSTMAAEAEGANSTIDTFWRPVTADEIASNYPEFTTCPGPDGITSRQLRVIPLPVLVRVFILFLACGRLPVRLLKAKTTLISKKKDAIDPGDYRPITVESILTLASRIIKIIKFDSRQFDFLPTDGCTSTPLN